MADSRELTTWKIITAEESRLGAFLIARPICEASYLQIRTDPARRSSVLVDRLQALFSLTGVQPDAAGYRRLLFAVLSEESFSSKVTGLRRPKSRVKSSDAKLKQPPQHMVGPLRTLASLTAQGFSKAAAIRRAVEEQNGIADHLDKMDPQPSPRKKITVHSLKAEEQRTRRQKKCLPGSVDEVALEETLDRQCFAAALEASAPRSDRWLDELGKHMHAYRQGKADQAACRRRMIAALDAELDRCAVEQPEA